MSNFDTVVLDGEMGLFTKVREGDLPYYTGATEVTPSDSTQVLETADTIVTENITINPIPDMDLEEVQVTYTPDEEGQTDTITPSTGYVGIAEVEVTVEPIDSDYVGSGIARKDSDDLTASGASVIAPAGYYEEAATKSVASGSATTPDTSITANPTISVGNDGSITASVSATQSVTPTVSAGYVSSGTAGNITVSGSGSAQLSTQAGTTITPTTSQQTAVAAGKFTTGNVVVDPMPSGTAGTPTATKGTVSNHSVSVTPSVTNQTGYITGGTKTGTAVTVSASELVSGNKAITANGTGIDVTEYATVSVAVPGDTPTLQTKSVSYTPTESQQTAAVTPDTWYDGLDQVNVTVGAIDSEYVGSDVPRQSSSDLSASGATVTAPAGYYASTATKSVASGSASTPATSITANPTISVSSSGLITATASASQSVTPSVTAGYVSAGTAGTVSVSGSATEQLSTQAAATITPTTSSQTAVVAGKYTTGEVTVGPIPPEYIIPTGTKSITENGTGIDVSGYAAVDVNVSGGGGDNKASELIMRTISGSYQNNDITLVGTYAFADAYNLSSVSFPNVSSVGLYGFRFCSNLSEVYMPSCSYIRQNAFFTCGIQTASFPSLKSTEQSAFANCAKLSYVNMPIISSIGPSCFSGCSQLSEVHIATSGAATCNIGANAFLDCSKLTTFDAPLVSYIGSYAFSSCTTIQSFSFPNVQGIRVSAFYKCYNLLSLYLMGSSVPSLHASNAFASTPIAGFTTSTGGVYGSIFVPESLYSDYITATNWATFSSRFVSLTDAQIAAL